MQDNLPNNIDLIPILPKEYIESVIKKKLSMPKDAILTNSELLDNIDLISKLPKDLTDFVINNKELLSELKKCERFNGRKIGEILKNYHGLRLSDCSRAKDKKGWIEFDDIIGMRLGDEPWPNEKELKKQRVKYESFCRGIDYAIRSSKGLIKSPFISEKTKDLLKEDVDRLSNPKKQASYKPFKDRPLHPDEMDVEGRAKTITQMTGRQVVEIYNYIKSFEREISERLYLDGLKDVDIFSLICEILNGTDFLKPYTKKHIKNLYENNVGLIRFF